MLVESIRSILAGRRQKVAQDVHTIARAAARGETPDPEEILAAVEAAGLDDDSFCDLVDLHARRDDLRRLAATAPAVLQEIEAIRSTIARHRAVLKAAEEKYREAVVPLATQEEQLQRQASEASSAETALTAAQNLPRDLVDRLEESRDAVLRTGAKVREVEAVAEREERRSRSAIEKLDREYGGVEKSLKTFDDPDERSGKSWSWVQLCEDARYGARRAETARQELASLVAARDAAERYYKQLQKEARDF